MDLWAGSSRRLQKSVNVQTDFRQLVEDMIRKLSVEELELFLVQAWMIWTQRNVATNGGTLQDPSQLVKRASVFWDEFRASQEQLAVPNPIERESRWVPPPGNCFKLNFDATIFQDLQASGFGAIIRNGSGDVMASISARGPPVIDSEEAEILACRKALEFAVDAGFRDLIVEGDNKVVMTSITSIHTTSSRLEHLYGDVNCIAAGIDNLTVNCVPRTANTVAHALARYARNVEDELVWVEESPLPAFEALYPDSS